MVLPFILAAVGAGVSHVATKAAKDSEHEEKLEHMKELLSLSPEQREAMDALKKQSLSEVRERVKLGIGPTKPLPSQASARAGTAHQAAVARKLQSLSPEERERVMAEITKLSPEEQAIVRSAANQDAAINQITEKKLASLTPEVVDTVRARVGRK